MELEEQDIEVSASVLKNAFLGIDEDTKTILEVFSEHNKRCKSLINIGFALGTYERHEACYKHVKRFISFMYHKNGMHSINITTVFIRDLNSILKQNGNAQIIQQSNTLKILRKLF